ncbi:MAG TPA: DNA repair protein [Pseudolabrys sp.]|jgi:protein ImuA
MIEELRQRLQALQRPPGIDDDPGVLSLGVEAIDGALGGGLARGALHEIAACGEAHLASATGFVLGLSSLGNSAGGGELVWVAEDMALTENGVPYGPGLEAFGLRPERLVTVQAARTRDLLWAMEEALRCRAVATVIGEMRDSEIDGVAVRRLSLAAAESGALALLLRAAPPTDASTAATRWIVGASPSPGAGGVAYAVSLIRNRRGPTGSWILQWSDIDERFLLATHAQPVAAPLLDRPHRQVA